MASMGKRVFVVSFLIAASLSCAAAQRPVPLPANPLDQGLWWLYQLQYDKAYAIIEGYTRDHPDDPAGYFYLTAIDWWHLAQDLDYDLPNIDARFNQNYAKTVDVADQELDQATTDRDKALACLYEGGAEGLKGRRLVTQGQWIRAYFAGRRGHKLLHRAIVLDPTLYDAYLGLGIYDYFTDTLPGVQRMLAALFIHGDKKRGLEELQLAIDHGQRAQVEAMMFLIEIYTYEEHQPEKALPLAEELCAKFPQSPAMHLAKMMALYRMQQWGDVIQEATLFLRRSTNEVPYYLKRGELPAFYLLGVAYLWGRHDSDTAMKYFEKILAQSDSTSRWVTYAYLRRGQVEDMRGEREKALADYHRVMARKDLWGSQQEARNGLDQPSR